MQRCDCRYKPGNPGTCLPGTQLHLTTLINDIHHVLVCASCGLPPCSCPLSCSSPSLPPHNPSESLSCVPPVGVARVPPGAQRLPGTNYPHQSWDCMFPTFTAEEIEQRWINQTGKPPSEWEAEKQKRRALVKLLLQVCSPKENGGLAINGAVCNTAALLFQYFRTLDPAYYAPAWVVATAALFLATKIHNYNKSIHDVCVCSLYFRMKVDPGYKGKENQLRERDFVEQHVAQVRATESDMLVAIGFDLNQPSPMMHLLRLAQSVGGLMLHVGIHTGLQTPRRTPARAGSAAPTGSGGSTSSGAAGAAAATPAVASPKEGEIINTAIGLINDSYCTQLVLEYNPYELAAAALFLAAGVHQHPLRVPPGGSYAAACSNPREPHCKIDSTRMLSLCTSMKEMYMEESTVHTVDVPLLMAKYCGQQPQPHRSSASSVPAAADEQPPPADGGKSPGEHSVASSKTTAEPPAAGQAGAADGHAGGTASPTSGARDGTPAGAPGNAAGSDHKQRPPGDTSQGAAHKRKRTPEESAAAAASEQLLGPGESRQKRQVSFALPVAI